MSSCSTGFAVAAGLVGLLVAGCGGSPPIAASSVPQTRVVATNVERSLSWIAPGAMNEDLLYISDFYGVHVYSYPKGVYVGDINAVGDGLCSDRAGDVFVANPPDSQVYEYAHGGTRRLKTLYDDSVDFGPINCSVDPTTENLAVSDLDSRDVVVFPKAKQRPRAYYEDTKRQVSMFFCAYDNKGNLFVDQVYTRDHQYVGELPKGKSRFINFLLDRRIAHAGGLQFDGKHVAIEDLGSHIVYQLRFSGSKAVVVGSTPLDGVTYVYQYWIQGKTLIGPDSSGNVYFWKYPKGGSPVRSIQGFTDLYGATVSFSS